MKNEMRVTKRNQPHGNVNRLITPADATTHSRAKAWLGAVRMSSFGSPRIFGHYGRGARHRRTIR